MCNCYARLCTACGCQAYNWRICSWREDFARLVARVDWCYTKDPCDHCARIDVNVTLPGSRVVEVELWNTCVYLAVLSRGLGWRCNTCQKVNGPYPQCRFFRRVEREKVPPELLGNEYDRDKPPVFFERCGKMINFRCTILTALNQEFKWDQHPDFELWKRRLSPKPSRREYQDKYIFNEPGPWPFSYPRAGSRPGPSGYLPPSHPQPHTAPHPTIKTEPHEDTGFDNRHYLPANIAPGFRPHDRQSLATAPRHVVTPETARNAPSDTRRTAHDPMDTCPGPYYATNTSTERPQDIGISTQKNHQLTSHTMGGHHMAGHGGNTGRVPGFLPPRVKAGPGIHHNQTAVLQGINTTEKDITPGITGDTNTAPRPSLGGRRATAHVADSRKPDPDPRDWLESQPIGFVGPILDNTGRDRDRDPYADPHREEFPSREQEEEYDRQDRLEAEKKKRRREEKKKKEKEALEETKRSKTGHKHRDSQDTINTNLGKTDSSYDTSESPSKRRRTHGAGGSSIRSGSASAGRGSTSGELRPGTGGDRKI